MNKNTFCIMAYKGFFVDSKKHVKPCCVFKNFEDVLIYDEKKSFDDTYNSYQFKDLRKKMDNGIIHKGCEDCFNGRINHREEMNNLFLVNNNELIESEMNISKDYTSDEILYLDLRLSNLCNFKCRMCNSSASSSWEDELFSISPSDYPKIYKVEKNWLKPIESQLEKIKFLYLAGGEPFIMSETFYLLNNVGHRKEQIKLFINTNLSNLTYKKIDIIDKIIGFNEIYLFVSCDGFDDIGEYQRTGFNTNKFKLNLKTILKRIEGLEKIELSITYALSSINVFNVFNDIKILKEEFNLSDDIINFQFVNTPWYYSVASGDEIFKNNVINYITKNLYLCGENLKTQLLNFITFIKNNHKEISEDQSMKDYEFIKKIDKIRKTDINLIAPWIIENIIYNNE